MDGAVGSETDPRDRFLTHPSPPELARAARLRVVARPCMEYRLCHRRIIAPLPLLSHPRSCPVSPAPQILGSPQNRRPTPLVHSASKSPSTNAMLIARGPSQVGHCRILIVSYHKLIDYTTPSRSLSLASLFLQLIHWSLYYRPVLHPPHPRSVSLLSTRVSSCRNIATLIVLAARSVASGFDFVFCFPLLLPSRCFPLRIPVLPSNRAIIK